MENTQGGRIVQSVANTCELVNALQKQEESTVTELGEHLDMSASSVHAHLTTLRQYGFVEKREGKYRLGPHFMPVGEFVRNHMQLYRAAKNPVDELAESTGEGAHLIIDHDGRVLSVYEAFGSAAIGQEYHTQKRERTLPHLHCTAAGKAILAYYSEDKVRSIVQQWGLSAQTEQTITDVDELLEELEEVRRRGFSLADREQLQGIRGVGAAIEDRNGEVVGSISLSAPASRLKGELFSEEIPEQVIHSANIAEINLQGASGNR